MLRFALCDIMVLIGYWDFKPINSRSKKEHTIWKSIKSWPEKRCQIVCGILFDLFECVTSSALCKCINIGSECFSKGSINFNLTWIISSLSPQLLLDNLKQKISAIVVWTVKLTPIASSFLWAEKSKTQQPPNHSEPFIISRNILSLNIWLTFT